MRTRESARRRLRRRQLRRLMQNYGLSREYAAKVLAVCYKRAG